MEESKRDQWWRWRRLGQVCQGTEREREREKYIHSWSRAQWVRVAGRKEGHGACYFDPQEGRGGERKDVRFHQRLATSGILLSINRTQCSPSFHPLVPSSSSSCVCSNDFVSFSPSTASEWTSLMCVWLALPCHAQPVTLIYTHRHNLWFVCLSDFFLIPKQKLLLLFSYFWPLNTLRLAFWVGRKGHVRAAAASVLFIFNMPQGSVAQPTPPHIQ